MPFLKPAAARRSVTIAAVVFVFLFLELSFAAETRSRAARETDLKAVFLLNFTQFVDWPDTAFPDPQAPFIIGVLGEDPFGKSLDDVMANETVKNRKIVVQRYHDVREVANCEVLFISQSESSRLGRDLDALRGKNILTVGETDAFTAAGGIIRFVLVQNKLRLKIDVEAAKAEHLNISSILLRQAEIVDTRTGQ